MRKYIDGLSRNKLERLLDQLLEQNDDLELINYISERIKTIDKLNVDFEHFSSDRIIPHSAEDEEKLDAFMRKFHVRDFLFLINSFSSTSSANRRKVFFYNGEFCLPYDFTLKQLDDFFKDDFNKKEYDGVFNTLNFIKNRFYEVGCGSVFEDHEEKKKICEFKLGNISKYLLDISSGSKLKLSIGNRGLVRSANGTYNHLHPYQMVMIDAFAFSSSLDDLENDKFDGTKRLLFLPRTVKVDEKK